MDTQDVSVQETTNPEVVVETTESTPEETGQTTADMVPKTQFNQVLARAKRAEEALKKVQPKTEITNEESKTISPSSILRAEEFKLYREGYTEDEIDLIMKNGGRKILEQQNNPISLGLKVAREQREAEEAASQVSKSAGQSEVERKYTPEQLQNMSRQELEKILPRVS